MFAIIKEALARAGIAQWSIRETREWTAELFFVRRSLDMRRMKETCKYLVTVYRDGEKDGKAMKGMSQVTVIPAQDAEAVKKAVESAYYAASFAANPTYPLPEKVTGAPVEADSTLADLPVEEAAMAMAGAIFAADTDTRAFVNSAEVFAEKRSVHLVASSGTDVAYTRYAVNGEFVAQCKEPEDVEIHHTFHYDSLDTDALTAKVGAALTQVADRAIAQRELPTGTYTLILSDEQVATVLSYYLERTSVSMAYPGYSTWRVGTDTQPAMAGGERMQMTLRATAPYSDEGIPMTDRPVIVDGKVALLHGGARLSAYMGVPATGNYRAFTCTNGTVPLAEMKKEPYLYPVSFSDFQMDSMSGHFGGEIRLAYYFDGRTTRIVTGGSVNGSILDCGGAMTFSAERYDSLEYKGPLAVRMPGVRVAGTLEEA